MDGDKEEIIRVCCQNLVGALVTVRTVAAVLSCEFLQTAFLFIADLETNMSSFSFPSLLHAVNTKVTAANNNNNFFIIMFFNLVLIDYKLVSINYAQ